MDHPILHHYAQMVNYFGELLGPQYEIILHIIHPDGGSHIGAIANNELSGRSLDAPLTDFALKMVQEKTYLEKSYVTNYKGVMSNGREFKSSTLFITDENNELIGLLCVNFDVRAYESVADQLLTLIGSSKQLTSRPVDAAEPLENFAVNIEQLIEQIVPPHYLDPNISLTMEQRLEIIKELDEKNVFQLKGAVSDVAKVLNVSEPTMYRYLKQIKDQ
ncbi:helix-turn-helix transcriptional regulator [Dolosicoccus paucivorans]|uniref:Transcriptional regulator n=1 Tax=Dolosicoccus paucivorans TaxID=84521 RepID=A0A1G8LHU1_9LACT|nr:PAS domain-containing protein [Dolosicoccus paucivorans]PMB84795.1 hypothetical protein CJ206_01920 [Dolosicoccus paucivorans]PMC58563.1 hypothetical protein CJ205_03850 [Dolosicoccus paucivorans]SDI55223.1 Predicted transcriptional regulator YheO, contains PAS and DNA-binding HTH domains [Dolosicoccus paucivorans]